MDIIGILGLLLAIVALIYLSAKGLNVFLAALIASAIIVVTNMMPFWESFTTHYALSMKDFVGNYFLLFGLASAYGAFMKASGAAESVAMTLFRLFGAKWAPVACIFVTLLMSLGGISAFVVVFAVYPVAAPLFRKSNISKNLMPGIFLCASVPLCFCVPGSPSVTNALLTMTALGTTAYAAPVMGLIACFVGLALSSIYVTVVAKRGIASGNGYVASGDDLLEEASEDGKDLPSFWTSILPLIVVIVMMYTLKGMMSTINCISTSLLIASALVVIFNYKGMKGRIVKTFTDGYWSSIGVLFMTAGVMGFAGIVQNAPQFQYFINFAMSLSNAFNPYLSGAIAINILAGVTSTALGSLQIFINTMLDSYLVLDINPEAFHRIMVLASSGLDTLPNSGTFITMCAVCGVTIKGCYKHVFALTVILPFILTALCILMALVGIV